MNTFYSDFFFEYPDGRKAYVLKFGTGKKTLLILPGMSFFTYESSKNEIIKQYTPLTEEYTVYFIDRARPVFEDCSCKSLTDDVLFIIDSLKIGSFSVYGISQGGALALSVCIRNPEIVEKAVIASAFSGLSETGKDTFETWYRLSLCEDKKKLFNEVINRVYSQEFLISNGPALDKLCEKLDKEKIREFGSLSKAMFGFDINSELDRIGCPLLLLGGEDDKVFGKESMPEIKKRTCSQSVFFENGSHAIYDEKTEIIGIIKKFLTE